MSIQPCPTLYFRRLPTRSAATVPFYWSRSAPMRYSILSSAMAITASAIMKTTCQSIPPTNCEECQDSPLPLATYSLHQHTAPTTIILASSPSSTIMTHHHDDHTDGAINNDAKQSTTPSWWKRIRQTFFVITRGMEILARLSPLLVLTPTAIAVSYIHPIWRKYAPTLFYLPSLTIESSSNRSQLDRKDNDDIFTMQFQGSNITSQQQQNQQQYHHHHNTTWASDLAWTYTLHTLQSLGPAFVKLAQWAATRRDLFPVHVCNRLSELHDTAWIHDWKHTHDALVDAFGEDYEARGLIVARSGGSGGGSRMDCGSGNGKNGGVLGSGSAAQVHRGTLTIPADISGGSINDTSSSPRTRTRNVAIKVLHPNTRQLVARDLDLMRHVAHFVDRCIPLKIVKMLSLPRAVSNFADTVERQVDLRIEGRNLTSFRRNFGCIGYYCEGDEFTTSSSHPPRAIDFPRPEMEWVSERVLVEEYAGDGALPISRYLADDSPEGLEVRKRLAGPLLRAFLKMVFVDNFIHADLHPGNVLVRAIPSRTNSQRVDHTIIFLDAGIATSLLPNDRNNLRDLFKAVVLNDGYSAGALMVERARYERCTSIPGGKHAFATGVSNIVSEFHDRRKQGLTLGAVRVGALLGKVLDLCRRYGVEIDPAMSSVVVSMLVLEGLGRSLDPDLNLMKAAVPYLLVRKV
mmetsp:Transcript_16723/g.31509  ORF Transcript_16723/g.31509 Transcript_16723/m.31509 type:complete len:688 (-) Transcript_16723:183-2246(-)